MKKRANWNFPQPQNQFSLELIGVGNDLGETNGHTQGVTFDGSYYYFVRSNGISKYTRNGNTYTLISERSTNSDSPAEKTQMNDGCFHNGSIWVGASNYILLPLPGGYTKRGWIIEYGTDLMPKAVYPVKNEFSEGGAWVNLDGVDNFFAVYHSWDHCSRYQFVGGVWTHIADYPLLLAKGTYENGGGRYQGCEWYNSEVMICTTHGNQPRPRVHFYRWNGNGFDPLESIPPVFKNAGQGLCWEVQDDVLLFADRDKYGNFATGKNRILRVQINYLQQ